MENRFLDKIYRLSPLGRADKKIRNHMLTELNENELQEYDNSVERYRKTLAIKNGLRVLLYASVITSAAATFNIDLSIISRIASYLGFTVILSFYMLTSYLAAIYKEDYHVQRDKALNRMN